MGFLSGGVVGENIAGGRERGWWVDLEWSVLHVRDKVVMMVVMVVRLRLRVRQGMDLMG